MRIIKIGRNPGNDVVINDDLKVSGSHCQIIKDDYGNYRLVDTNSTNGTYVNGVRRNGEISLNQSDIVRIGNTTLPWQNYFSNLGGGGTDDYGGGYPGGNGTNNPQQTKPNNFLVWAILSTIFCCLPFGIVSIVYAAKVDGLWSANDRPGAMEAARKAKTWFWWSFGIGIALLLLSTIYYFIVGAALFSKFL